MRRRLIISAIGASVAGTASGAQWTFTPSIGLNEIFTDNVAGSETNKRADVITQLAPQLDVSAVGSRDNLQLSYRPTISIYAATPGQDRIDQNLTGAGSIIPFENRLNVDFQVFAAQNSGNGGYFTPVASGLVPYSNRVLNYGGTLSPHYQERFGDVATFDAYYRLSSSNTSQQSSNTNINRTNGLSNNLLQQDAQVILGSGDSFGRLVTSLNLDHVDGSGSGFNNQYQEDTDIVQFEYHITHEYSVTGSAGYERTHYNRTTQSLGYNQSGLTWSIGFRAAPNDKTEFDVSYGRRQGGDNVNAHLTYDLSPRTFITASYDVTVQNQLQSALNNLPFLTFNQFGNPIDSRTGLPYNQVNQAFGQQNTLFRSKNAQVSISRQFERATLTLTAYDQRREPLSGSSASDDAWGTTLSYTHELTPVLQGNADIGYNDHQPGAFSFGGFGTNNQHDRFLNADAGLTFSVNETVTATVVYSFNRRISNTLNNSETTNQLMVGVRKTF